MPRGLGEVGRVSSASIGFVAEEHDRNHCQLDTAFVVCCAEDIVGTRFCIGRIACE